MSGICSAHKNYNDDCSLCRAGLLPCPFCGGNNLEIDGAAIYDDDESYTEWVVCIDCDICGPVSKNAKRTWNKRSGHKIKDE